MSFCFFILILVLFYIICYFYLLRFLNKIFLKTILFLFLILEIYFFLLIFFKLFLFIFFLKLNFFYMLIVTLVISSKVCFLFSLAGLLDSLLKSILICCFNIHFSCILFFLYKYNCDVIE